ncbi:MAG: hypothetical protein ACYDEV_04205 [Acidiferrobacter sp.]
MRSKKLKLAGFTGISADLGRPEIALDFEQLVGDAALVAITGPNGIGKTTIMDNLTPYRVMPSRVSTPKPSAFSYYDHMSGSSAFKELEWEHEGQRYRTSIVLKITGRTRKQDAFLHVLQDGVWVPVEIDGLTSDGKTDTYDSLVACLLGEPEVFFASQFRAQGARSLGEYTNGEIKTLMSGMLGLESIRSLGARASQVAKLLRAGLEALRNTLGALTSLEATLPDIEAQAQTAQAAVNTTEQRHKAAQAQESQARATLSTAQAQAAALAEGEARRTRLQAQLHEAQAGTAAAIETVTRDSRDAQGRLSRARAALSEEHRQTALQQERLRAEGQKQKALLDRREEIASAGADRDSLRAQEQVLTAQVQAEQALAAEIQQIRHRKTVLQGTLQGLARERAGQCRHRDTLAQQSRLVQDVPCRDTPMQGTCPLLREAIQAGRALGPIEVALQEMDGRVVEHEAEIAHIDLELAKREAQYTAGAEQALKDVMARIRQTEQVASLSSAVEVADTALRSAREQWRSVTDASTIRVEALQKDIAEAERTLQDLETRKAALVADGQKAQAAIQAEMASLPVSEGAAKITAAEAVLSEAIQALTQREAEVETARKTAAARQAAWDAARAELAAGTKTRDRAHRIEAEISRWNLLAKALGNDGIVALSIDDAGPELARLTNDLLATCYGPRFTVSIQTQIQTAKGELQEGFEILVYDAHNGTSAPLNMKSGGQRVWLNDAITRAIALYLSQISGRRCRTLFADEADGPLDVARRRQLMATKRRVLEIGGYEQEFFVSQSPELWGMADAIIDLEALVS